MVIVPGMTLQATLSTSASTSDPEIHAVFTDWTPDPNRKAVPLVQRSVISDTTDTIILDAPVNNQARELTYMSVHNLDTVNHTVIVKTDDGTTERRVIRRTISVGAALCYEQGHGWYVLPLA